MVARPPESAGSGLLRAPATRPKAVRSLLSDPIRLTSAAEVSTPEAQQRRVVTTAPSSAVTGTTSAWNRAQERAPPAWSRNRTASPQVNAEMLGMLHDIRRRVPQTGDRGTDNTANIATSRCQDARSTRSTRSRVRRPPVYLAVLPPALGGTGPSPLGGGHREQKHRPDRSVDVGKCRTSGGRDP
jgi:hypothetical protein